MAVNMAMMHHSLEIAKELEPQSQDISQNFGTMGNLENQKLFGEAMKKESLEPSFAVGKLSEMHAPMGQVSSQMAAIVQEKPFLNPIAEPTFGDMMGTAVDDLRTSYDNQFREFEMNTKEMLEKGGGMDPTDMVKINYAMLVMGAMTTMVTTAESNIKGTLQQLLTAQ